MTIAVFLKETTNYGGSYDRETLIEILTETTGISMRCRLLKEDPALFDDEDLAATLQAELGAGNDEVAEAVRRHLNKSDCDDEWDVEFVAN